MKKELILVTGGAGYVGSGLLRSLLKEGYRVVCVDNLLFGGESLLDIWHDPSFEFIKADITEKSQIDSILKKYNFHGIIHLAAIVGDPACKLNPDKATHTNWHASKYLLNEAYKKNINRFIFASTCSNYGKMPDPNAFVDERSPLAPVSLYAELKVKFEEYLLNEYSQSDSFTPTALRFSTVYGVSPRMRFDLTVNEFTKEITLGKKLVVFGEQFWRPYCHVRDFSRAFLTVLKAPKDKVAFDVFNVGDTSENYTKQMIVDEIIKNIPEAQIEYVKKNEDPRDYRVNSDKIKNKLGFEISLRVADGVKEVIEIVKSGVIQNPENQNYYNIPHQ